MTLRERSGESMVDQQYYYTYVRLLPLRSTRAAKLFDLFGLSLNSILIAQNSRHLALRPIQGDWLEA